ncbi:hypothetical protein FACS189419_06640 [Planctomycetales bacterium]|nr:hypothetical protein FACS189419_06640 [Planctomycetales bacterium]
MGDLIQFELGSDELNSTDKQKLDSVYTKLVGSPQRIIIKGHTVAGEYGIYRRCSAVSVKCTLYHCVLFKVIDRQFVFDTLVKLGLFAIMPLWSKEA